MLSLIMNHYGLFIKLMGRCVPINLLSVLENWFEFSVTCVKWGSVFSRSFSLACGVRQGGVLSPHLFALYIDSVVQRVRASNVGCYYKLTCVSILLYADDILLIAPSITSLQQLLLVCEAELNSVDMSINVRKSTCMRVGPRFNNICSHIITSDGRKLLWSNEIRYLGVILKSARQYSCSFGHAKRSFYRAFNAVFGKVGRVASEAVTVELLKTKCLPVLYYGLEACPLNKSDVKSLDYVLYSSFSKIFCTNCKDIINDCMVYFGCHSIDTVLQKRRAKFLTQYALSENSVCKLFKHSALHELDAMHIAHAIPLN